jgi:hypothetical protein
VHALNRLAFGVGIAVVLVGCHRKASQTQCDALVDHYSELAMKEQFPDAAPADIEAQKKVVRDEAKNDDDFKNCTSEVEVTDYDCAMKATTTDAIEHCLE